MPARVAVVEDEQITSMELQAMLGDIGYEVAGTFSRGEEILEHLKKNSDKVDLILMDIRLPGEVDGIETAGIIEKKYKTPVVYVTAHSDWDTLNRAKETHPRGYIIKPITEPGLRSSVEMALE